MSEDPQEQLKQGIIKSGLLQTIESSDDHALQSSTFKLTRTRPQVNIGSGEEIFYDNSRFVGTYENGLRQGDGTFYVSEDHYYRGPWKRGILMGDGEIHYDKRMYLMMIFILI